MDEHVKLAVKEQIPFINEFADSIASANVQEMADCLLSEEFVAEDLCAFN